MRASGVTAVSFNLPWSKKVEPCSVDDYEEPFSYKKHRRDSKPDEEAILSSFAGPDSNSKFFVSFFSGPYFEEEIERLC